MNWITDANGNRASVLYWGSEETARASLSTLTNCRYCTDCRYCNLSLEHYFLPVSEPRRYTWMAIKEPDGWRIRAGCRNFTIKEARAHWTAPDYDGPECVRETVGFALDWLEGKIKA